MKNMMRGALVAAAIGMFANTAQASPVKLDWTTTVSQSGTSGLSAGSTIKMSFVFNPTSADLSNARLNASNFVSYSFTLSDGRYATFDTTGPGSALTYYTGNDYFVFDAAGALNRVGAFHITDGSITSNVTAWNGLSSDMYNNGANCFTCSSGMNFSVNNVQAGLSASSWSVGTANNVPEPATLSLFAVGVLGCGWMRRRKAA